MTGSGGGTVRIRDIFDFAKGFPLESSQFNQKSTYPLNTSTSNCAKVSVTLNPFVVIMSSSPSFTLISKKESDISAMVPGSPKAVNERFELFGPVGWDEIRIGIFETVSINEERTPNRIVPL